jgi:asparagine synthase (glutamine-hydrolysing)
MIAFGVQRLTTGKAVAFFTIVAQKLRLPETAVDRLFHFASALERADDFKAFYRDLVSVWPDPSCVLGHQGEVLSVLDESTRLPMLEDPAQQLMAYDILSYLPDDILVKVDRSAMSCSLETRAPFLDARVVEHAWALPLSAKFEGGVGKRILRDILAQHVPRELFERPKQGFAIPVDNWLRGKLKEWASDLLSRTAIEQFGCLDASAIERTWQAHLSGRSNAGARLWNILMLQSWLNTQKRT